MPDMTTMPADQRFNAAQQAADAQLKSWFTPSPTLQATSFVSRAASAPGAVGAPGSTITINTNRGPTQVPAAMVQTAPAPAPNPLMGNLSAALSAGAMANATRYQSLASPATPPVQPRPAAAPAQPAPPAQPAAAPTLPAYSFANPSGVLSWAPPPAQPAPAAAPQPAGVAIYRGSALAPSFEGAPGAAGQNSALANLSAIAQTQRDSARVTADDMGQRLTVAAMNHPELAPEIFQGYGTTMANAMRSADGLTSAGAGMVDTNTEAAASMASNAANNVTARRGQDFDLDVQRNMPRIIGNNIVQTAFGPMMTSTYSSINNPVPLGASATTMNTAQMVQGWRAANPSLSQNMTDEQVVAKIQALQQPTVTR